jgi:mRNA-degrading endonuclease YafQ of YafQ-DinJ toxin-antitoxin module
MYNINLSPKAERVIKKMKHKELENLYDFFNILKNDPFDTRLKTHKLKGELKNYFSARLSYSDRVVFVLKIENEIYVIDIGSHDEVY